MMAQSEVQLGSWAAASVADLQAAQRDERIAGEVLPRGIGSARSFRLESDGPAGVRACRGERPQIAAHSIEIPASKHGYGILTSFA